MFSTQGREGHLSLHFLTLLSDELEYTDIKPKCIVWWVITKWTPLHQAMEHCQPRNPPLFTLEATSSPSLLEVTTTLTFVVITSLLFWPPIYARLLFSEATSLPSPAGGTNSFVWSNDHGMTLGCPCLCVQFSPPPQHPTGLLNPVYRVWTNNTPARAHV